MTAHTAEWPPMRDAQYRQTTKNGKPYTIRKCADCGESLKAHLEPDLTPVTWKGSLRCRICGDPLADHESYCWLDRDVTAIHTLTALRDAMEVTDMDATLDALEAAWL